MKALAIPLAGQSIYVPFIGLLISGIYLLSPIGKLFFKHFTGPLTAVLGLCLIYYVLTGYHADVFVFGAKILTLFAMAALYLYLLQLNEGQVMKYLYWGAVVSIVYMVYQALSVTFFGSGLPLTSVSELQIGRGLGSRYGLVRTTGFTEEPSYIAVMLVGTGLMLRSYEKRSQSSQRSRYFVLLVGLLLCTSNSLLATLPLLILFSFFYYFRAPFLFFIVFYLANLAIAPLVLNIDESFFARFASYAQFLGLPASRWWLGIGFGQYSSLPYPVFISPEGLSTFVVDSIASLWGGVLLEGGIVFATLFCLYLTRITQLAKDSTGYALMAILIMLANYYSPWWPIVSLALAYTIASRNPSQPVEA